MGKGLKTIRVIASLEYIHIVTELFCFQILRSYICNGRIHNYIYCMSIKALMGNKKIHGPIFLFWTPGSHPLVVSLAQILFSLNSYTSYIYLSPLSLFLFASVSQLSLFLYLSFPSLSISLPLSLNSHTSYIYLSPLSLSLYLCLSTLTLLISIFPLSLSLCLCLSTLTNSFIACMSLRIYVYLNTTTFYTHKQTHYTHTHTQTHTQTQLSLSSYLSFSLSLYLGHERGKYLIYPPLYKPHSTS